MINKIASSLLLLLLFSSAQADHPKDEVERWLEKMHHAAHMINYDGTFVYGQHDELSSMKILHAVDENGESERLTSLDGSRREVIRSGDTVICILPDKKSVVVDKSRPDSKFPPAFPLKVKQLSEFYIFHFSGEGRVAGHAARKLVITPKDKYRYGHQLWIDKKTGLLLKDHLIGDDGKIVEQFMFTQINYPDMIEKTRFSTNVKKEKFTWYKAEEPAVKSTANKSMNWKVVNLPPGFVSGMKRHHNMTMSAMPVEHFMFSDGLSSISVFVEKQMENSKNLMGSSTMGAVNAYGRAIGKYHVTVVGEVPNVTVKMIGNSVIHIK